MSVYLVSFAFFRELYLSEASCPNESAVTCDNVEAEVSPIEEPTTMVRPPQLRKNFKDFLQILKRSV